MDERKRAQKIHSSITDSRKAVRRNSSDRRTEVRFEPDKENRRLNKGRRSSDKDIWGS